MSGIKESTLNFTYDVTTIEMTFDSLVCFILLQLVSKAQEKKKKKKKKKLVHSCR